MFRILLMTFVASTVWAAPLSMESLSLDESDASYSANVKFDSELTEGMPTVEYINDTIQIDIPQVQVKDGKISRKIDGDKIKTLFAYQLDEETARFRIILNKGAKAEQFKDVLSLESEGNLLKINIKKPVAMQKTAPASPSSITVKNVRPREFDTATQAVVSAPVVAAISTDIEKLEEASMEEELKKLAKKSEPVAETVIPEVKKDLAENQIPVLAPVVVKKSKADGFSGLRVVLGMGIVAIGLLGLWFAANKFLQKKNLKNPHTSIRVVTQHYLGPKKSLAIVSVAGESILIGITDQNISMIKSLSLLDDDVAQMTPKDFGQTLKAAEEGDADSVEDYAVKGIKDIVSDRLKGMRNLW